VVAKRPVLIGVDLAGADVTQRSLFAACEHVVCDTSVSVRCYHSSPLPPSSSIECRHCPDVITMEDEALSAIRKKKASSLVQAMQDLKGGEISALVTCANTGAVTAAAVVYLKRFSGLHHPPLIATLPLPCGQVVALDMGAFITATGEDLVAYARLGSAYATACVDISQPRVGLLNIGKEMGRGTIELRQADEILRSTVVNECTYVGNVEPEDILSGKVDVVVTSGFAGNIFLKTAEAVVKLSSPTSYTPKGALLGGVRGIVIKCHGVGSGQSLVAAIEQARVAVEHKIAEVLETLFCKS
jgi:fatty acid/phospholipid biosynthesis enzyme